MILAGELNIIAERYAPLEIDLTITGIDLTDAVMHMQVRDAWNGSAILVNLTDVPTLGAEGISLASTIVTAGVTSSLIKIVIDAATMLALPVASPVYSDLGAVWDLHITPDGGVRHVYYRGTFTVRGGATRAA
jgi:hypothetical protein